MLRLIAVLIIGALLASCSPKGGGSIANMEERKALIKGAGVFKSATEQEYTKAAQNISIKKVDLNGDGSDEYIIIFNQMEFCGSMGCSFAVLKKSANKYELLLESSVNGNEKDVTVGSDSINGWKSITADINGGPELHRYTYLYDGARYAESSCVVVDKESGKTLSKSCPK